MCVKNAFHEGKTSCFTFAMMPTLAVRVRSHFWQPGLPSPRLLCFQCRINRLLVGINIVKKFQKYK